MTSVDLSAFPDSNAVAEACKAAGIPEWELFGRVTLDSNPGVNQLAVALAANGTTAEDFNDFLTFMHSHPNIFPVLDGALRKILWWQYAPRLTNLTVVPRTQLFLQPEFEYPGGILANVEPLDEVYFVPTLAQLRTLLAYWRAPYTYKLDDNDCDDFAAQLRGDAKHLPPHLRPAIGEAAISCISYGRSYLHRLCIAPTTDAGMRWVDIDGHDYPLARAAGPYTDIKVISCLL